ncbi:MAG: LysR family transcriptional regulator [Burkholderiaceae bacterium]
MAQNVTLRQFKYFIAVAESNSTASASRMLSIAQSAITKSILELEDTLGIALFERSPRGMTLTPEGHRFLVRARKVIAAVADATHMERTETEALSGTLTIGVTSLVAGYYLSELLRRFRRNCPQVEVQVVEDAPGFLEHLLINGEVDAAIMVSNTLEERQALVAETLVRSPLRVWLAADHPLAAQDDVALAQCAAQKQIVLRADGIDELIRRMWGRYALKPASMLKTTSLEAVRSLVGSGAGIAVLPDFLYRAWTLDAEHVDVRNLREELPTVDIGLVWRRGTGISATLAEFIEVSREQPRGFKPVG